MQLGDGLPDLDLIDHLGQAWRPGEHRGRPLVLILHRHLG